ncbi:MAG: hypothetical protein IID40_01345 [Planctomycetes bacterium]|nr:hypothetical protein [Planctomycetota bacterium]
MNAKGSYRWLMVGSLLALAIGAGCDAVALVGGGDLFVVEEEQQPQQPLLTVERYATNTGDAAGIALDADGGLILVNNDGLFGPLEKDDDVATLTAFGAENVSDEATQDEFFDNIASSLVLVITNSGEYWIGTPGNVTLAVVPPGGGDAEPFTGLLNQPTPEDPSNIKPETMVIVPDNHDGDQIRPGTLLVGRETSFSELSTIDVAGDRAVINIDNPIGDPDELDNPDDALDRYAHHLTFGPDGTLYGSSGQGRKTAPNVQTIALDGTPTNLAGTERLAVHSFVVLPSGDLLIRGVYTPENNPINGLMIWSAADEAVIAASVVDLEDDFDLTLSEDDEIVLADDGKTAYLSLVEMGEIWRAIDNRE